MSFKEKFTAMKTEIEDFFKGKDISVVVEEDKVANLVVFKKGNEELKPEKFEDIPLMDGVTIATIEPTVEAGSAIVLQTSDTEPIPAPAGEYELQDGRIVVVVEPGMIAEVKEAAIEEPTDEPMGTDEPNEPGKVKRIIESIVKEKQFATNEDLDLLKKENEELKKELREAQEAFGNLSKFVEDKFTAICDMVGDEPEKDPAVKGKFSQVLAEDENGNPIIKTVKTA